MDTNTAQPAWELTRNPVDETWGFICREHGLHRSGLTERHATNVEAKHLREDHADPTPVLDLTAAALEYLAGRKSGAESGAVWEALTGLTGPAAVQFARTCADAEESPVTAAVVPF